MALRGTGGTGGGGGIDSVVAGTNITIDNSDPANPIISANGTQSDFIAGKTVANFSALPSPITNDGLLAVAIADQGVWMVNFKSKGLYFATGSAWVYQGDYELTDEASEIENTPSGNITSTNVQSAINELDIEKVSANSAITGATKTKITYDAKGLVTGGADLLNSDLPVMTATVGGAVPTPPNNTTTFLRGDGTFAVPAGGGGGGLTQAQTLSRSFTKC